MDLLEKLLNAFGVSGSEENIRKIIVKEIKRYVDKISVDKVGNLIAYKRGKSPKVMLAAHLDEIGLIVKTIDGVGRIYFSNIGVIEPITLLGQRVSVDTKKGLVYGVITTDDISNSFTIDNKPRLVDLFIDTGLAQNELIKIGVKTGDYIFFKRKTINLGSKNLVSSKALDDRVGCYILVQLAKKLKKAKNETYFVFTVQEEVGLYGAKTSAYSIDPDWAIAVDVTNADDFTDSPTNKMGYGPCITIIELAKKHKIPLQYDVSDLGTTDALSISLSRRGVPATALTVPVRNIHTTIGIVNREDIENEIKLLELLLKNPPKLK